jgi:hypothetical protein
MRRKLYTAFAALTLGSVHTGIAQSVDLGTVKDNFKKENLIKLNGGIQANTVWDIGSGESRRQPFTYFVNGNLNARLFNLIDLPFSVFLTNAGQGLNYPTPPNRLSLHPTYKWATAHVGDVAMSFSPYTLNGHQFSGVGVDLTPGKFQVSAMYGRLQKAEVYNPKNLSTPAAYQRMGYGAKVSYVTDKWRLGYTAFAAKDDPGSIGFVPDSLDIRPAQNVVMSWEGGYQLLEGLVLNAEYATSGLTQDSRDTTSFPSDGVQVLRPFMKELGSTAYFHAMRAGLNYSIRSTVVGLGYERIDPGYRTLGAYFFNEDLENYTVNASQRMIQDKLNLSGNVGFQRDNLAETKRETSNRFVGSINASYTANEWLSVMASYSNFQTHMNIRSQFDQINQIGPYVNYDTLNFSQITQNAMANVYYTLSKTESRIQGINLNVTFLDAVDKQGDVIRSGGASQFYNTSLAYTLQLVPKNINISAGFNGSYNTIGTNNFTTLGPIMTLNAQLLKKKINTSLSASYNVSSGTGMQKVNVFNARMAASYAVRKNNSLNMSIMNQLRDGARGSSFNLVTTLGYGFRF